MNMEEEEDVVVNRSQHENAADAIDTGAASVDGWAYPDDLMDWLLHDADAGFEVAVMPKKRKNGSGWKRWVIETKEMAASAVAAVEVWMMTLMQEA